MVTKKGRGEEEEPQSRPPATSREARQARMENLALDLIEKRFISGEATSQETTLFARSASTRGRIEEARLEAEVALMHAKKVHLESQEELQEMFKNAIIAMGSYRVEDPEDEYPEL